MRWLDLLLGRSKSQGKSQATPDPTPVIEQGGPAETYYYVAGEEKGETVVKKVPSTEASQDVVKAYEKGETVARGTEAEAMIKTARGQIEGLRAGRHGGGSHARRSYTSARKKYEEAQKQAEQLQAETEKLNKEAEQLAAERQRLEQLRQQDPSRYNAAVAAYNARVGAYEKRREELNAKIAEFNKTARQRYLELAYAAGYAYGAEVGRQEYERIENDPLTREVKKLAELEKKDPLRAFAIYAVTGIASHKDPFGLYSVAKAATEGHEAALQQKAEAWLDIERAVQENGMLGAVEKVVTGPFVTTTVAVPAVSYGAGFLESLAARISPYLGGAVQLTYATAGGYTLKKAVVDPYMRGEKGIAAANVAYFTLAAPFARSGYIAGAERGRTVAERLAARITKLSIYKKARFYLTQRQFQKQYSRFMEDAAAFEEYGEKFGPYAKTYTVETPSGRPVKVKLIRYPLTREGIQYEMTFEPAEQYHSTIAIQIPKPISRVRRIIPRTHIYKPSELEEPARISYFGRDRYAPTDIYPPEMVSDAHAAAREFAPFPPVVFFGDASRSAVGVSSRLRVGTGISLRYSAIARIKAATLQAYKLQYIEGLQEGQAQAVRQAQRIRYSTKQIERTATQEVPLTLTIQRAMVKLRETLPRYRFTTPRVAEPVRIHVSDVVEPFFRRGAPRRPIFHRPRFFSFRFRLPRFTITKSVLPDPISKMITELRIGRAATAPLPTRRVWRIAERSLYMFVPTAEMLRTKKRRPKKKRKSYNRRRR